MFRSLTLVLVVLVLSGSFTAQADQAIDQSTDEATDQTTQSPRTLTTEEAVEAVETTIGVFRNAIVAATGIFTRNVVVRPRPDGLDGSVSIVLNHRTVGRLEVQTAPLVEGEVQTTVAQATRLMASRILDIRERDAEMARSRRAAQVIGGDRFLNLARDRSTLGASTTVGGNRWIGTLWIQYQGVESDRLVGEEHDRVRVRSRFLRSDFTYEGAASLGETPSQNLNVIRVNLSIWELAFDGRSGNETGEDTQAWIRLGAARWAIAELEGADTVNRMDIDFAEIGFSRVFRINSDFAFWGAVTMGMGARVLENNQESFEFHVRNENEIGIMIGDHFYLSGFLIQDIANGNGLPGSGTDFRIAGAEAAVRLGQNVILNLRWTHRFGNPEALVNVNLYEQTPDGSSGTLGIRVNFY